MARDITKNHKKIIIIGAGWYGCHIAKKMYERGHKVTIVDQANIFSGASKYNQNRLHLGFHYPRCAATRLQSKRGHHLFKKEYGFLTKPLDYNLYAVPQTNSIIDFETYKLIMTGSGLEFEDITSVSPVPILNVRGIIDCTEDYICPKLSAKYFELTVGNMFKIDTNINRETVKNLKLQYDYVIDCTWGALSCIEEHTHEFEVCLYHIYESTSLRNIAITLMDGNFFSIFPYQENTFTVTHVKHIKQGSFSTMNEAVQHKNEISKNKALIDDNRKLVEADINKYLHFFEQTFNYVGHQISIKTKIPSATESRYVTVARDGNYFSVLSGKIDTVFDADAIIHQEIMKDLR